MKNTLKLILALVLVASMAFSMVGCSLIFGQPDNGGEGTGDSGDNGDEGKPVVPAQGIDTEKHTILVGNTAATSGAFAAVGVPFNYAQEAYFWYYTNHTDGYKDADGNKYTIAFKHYDDGFDGPTGNTYTKKLVEEDKVFALVGHFGSNTVSATVDYLEGKEIPMVYGVCGVSDLYNTEANIMTVQPIYDTEGQSMVATAFAPVEAGGLGATKLGVISTTDEAGKGMLNG
ncbi:MAG: ABC transporter substrate-binding protein, partial [Clostridia bacterium]|nr:ABC transporter substrate-binding protein [Clostridia bacterium]